MNIVILIILIIANILVLMASLTLDEENKLLIDDIILATAFDRQ